MQFLFNGGGVVFLSTGTHTHLFVKVPQPGDSEFTFSVFESSFHLLLTTSLTTQR